MKTHEVFPIIYVEDVAASLAFYRDLLGFAETFRFPETGDPEFVGLSNVALARASDGQTGSHGQPMHPRSGQQFELCVYVDDVDAAVDELRSHGAPVLVEPVDQPWGERMAYVADPTGHPVMLCAKVT
jgi:lactoylglutathione lyase